jgi:mono/diheme cytochrome c family protein
MSHLLRNTIIVGMLTALILAGCRKEEMADQPRYDPMEQSGFFADGQSARPLVEGTVARGHKPVNDQLFAVTSGPPANQQEAVSFPDPLTPADLEIGHQQFDIYCAVCHGRLGDGNGMIVQRGFPKPPSFIVNQQMTDRERNLQTAPVGHFYNVISFGYGAMYSYGDRIRPEVRWKIVGYIKALQLSQAKATMTANATAATSQPASQPAAAPTTQPTK